MRVVVDTNVLVSAALKDRDPEHLLLHIADHPNIEWIVSDSIIEEYKSVLSRPRFHLPDTIVQQWLSLIDRLITVIEQPEGISFPRDQKDAKFIECALAAGADYLITGDRDFIEARKMMNTTIVSVATFIRVLYDS